MPFTQPHSTSASSAVNISLFVCKWACGCFFVLFFLTDVPSAACLLRCSGEACFHLSCLCHTKSEGEEWEITLFPVSVNLGHRASGGNTPGSFSPWVTAGGDLSLSLCHPSSLHPYCSSIIILSARVPSVCIVFLFFKKKVSMYSAVVT